jgi:hypothetical protein
MSDVRLVETVDEEGFATAPPYKTEALLESVVWGAVTEGINDMEGAREAKGVLEEQAPEGIAVLDGDVDDGRGMKEFFIFVGWQPSNSF